MFFDPAPEWRDEYLCDDCATDVRTAYTQNPETCDGCGAELALHEARTISGLSPAAEFIAPEVDGDPYACGDCIDEYGTHDD